jgi:hypothetical protein
MDPDLMDYITDNQEIERTPYRVKLKELNLLLTMNGFSEIGDLFDNSLFSVNKTLTVLKSLLDDRKKLIEAKTDLLQKISKTENEYTNMFKSNEIQKDKITELTNLNNFLKNKIYKEEKSFRVDIEKLKLEKEELNKTISKLSQKETKWKHEIKKKDIELSDLKNKLRKYMNDKDMIVNSMNSNNNVNMKINQTLTNINYATPSKEVLISFENLIKNSNSVLMNVNHLKEFYNLLFQAFNEKINYILNENNDLRECYKIILREINKYMDFKKLLLQKLSKDIIKDKIKIDNSNVNEGLLQLDFNDSREQILNNFNEILNTFRYILIYDQLKVDPNKEFNYDEMTKMITNTKYDLKSLPYYKEIADLMENFDVNALKTLKGTLDSLNIQTQDLSKNDILINKDNLDINNLGNDIKSVETLEEINKEFSETLNFLDAKILLMKDKIDKNKNDSPEKNITRSKITKNTIIKNDIP